MKTQRPHARQQRGGGGVLGDLGSGRLLGASISSPGQWGGSEYRRSPGKRSRERAWGQGARCWVIGGRLLANCLLARSFDSLPSHSQWPGGQTGGERPGALPSPQGDGQLLSQAHPEGMGPWSSCLVRKDLRNCTERQRSQVPPELGGFVLRSWQGHQASTGWLESYR